MEALYALGPSQQRTTNLAKTLERRRCNHRTALPSDECLADVIGISNKHRYVLAAQSADLLAKMDRVPGVPVIHFNGRGVAVLSPPGVATVREKVKGEEERRLGEKAAEESLGAEGGNVIGAGSKTADIKGRGRKTANPNPLSMRKKKVSGAEGKDGAGKKKRERDTEEEDEEDEGKALDDDERIGGEKAGAGDAESAGRKKKKRKRRGKGEVALAIEELNETGLGGTTGPEATAGVSGSESDS
jgi:U3 small nucleolar RNA-associated protein 23